MRRHMGNPTICLIENKCADQLRSNCEADQRLCFRYSDSTVPLHFKLLACFCDCTGRFVSDLFENHIEAAHCISCIKSHGSFSHSS